MPTKTPHPTRYAVECVALVANPNQGTGPFRYLAKFIHGGRPGIKLEIAALPLQYEPGQLYHLDMTRQTDEEQGE